MNNYNNHLSLYAHLYMAHGDCDITSYTINLYINFYVIDLYIIFYVVLLWIIDYTSP